MEEILEIVLQAIDNASNVFSGVTDSAEDMGESLSSAAEGAESSFDGVQSSADSVSDAVGGIDGTSLGDVASSADEASNSSENAGNALDEVATILGGIAGLEAFEGISQSLMEMADAAGTFNDSVMRAGLEAEGAGIPVGEMKDAVSELSDATGRAGGQIRESFIKATARGVTDMDSFKTMMEGAGAQATLLGTDIQSMGNKFSSMAQKDTLMARALAETGVTMDELGVAMGMTGATADEVKEKWKELDTNQRAAILGTAASMNEGEEANEAYKNSWAGLNEKLDIAKSRIFRLAGEVLLPVLIPAIDIASRILSTLGDVISGVMEGPFGTLISIAGSAAAAFALAVPAYMAVSAALTFLTGPALAAAGALWAAVAPLLPFIAIGAAIVFIIYEIGKAFGWWTDVGSMIDAIGAGLQRLWSAFINHPDVQAAISIISSALQTLWGYIQQAGQAVLEFFGITSDSNFDIVRALIDGLGATWDAFKMKIQLLVDVFMAFHQVVSWVATTLWSIFGPAVMAIINGVQGLMTAFNLFRTGQINLPQTIMTVLQTLLTMYTTIFNAIVGRLARFGMQMIQRGISSAQSFVTGIISRVRQLPSRVYSALIAVVTRIASAISQWASTAASKVQSVISSITSPFSGVSSAISGALSGVVSAIVAPFQNAWNQLKPLVDNIKGAMELLPHGGDTAYGGDTAVATNGQTFNITTGQYIGNQDNSPIVIEDNINLSLDLRNVPSHIDTTTLIEALTDKTVLNALVNNRDFQDIDSRVKQKLDLKVRRSGH